MDKNEIRFLNSETKLKSLNEIETYGNGLHVIKHDEMNKSKKILHQMRSIDAEFET
jgi:hypothetical protein